MNILPLFWVIFYALLCIGIGYVEQQVQDKTLCTSNSNRVLASNSMVMISTLLALFIHSIVCIGLHLFFFLLPTEATCRKCCKMMIAVLIVTSYACFMLLEYNCSYWTIILIGLAHLLMTNGSFYLAMQKIHESEQDLPYYIQN